MRMQARATDCHVYQQWDQQTKQKVMDGADRAEEIDDNNQIKPELAIINPSTSSLEERSDSFKHPPSSHDTQKSTLSSREQNSHLGALQHFICALRLLNCENRIVILLTRLASSYLNIKTQNEPLSEIRVSN